MTGEHGRSSLWGASAGATACVCPQPRAHGASGGARVPEWAESPQAVPRAVPHVPGTQLQQRRMAAAWRPSAPLQGSRAWAPSGWRHRLLRGWQCWARSVSEGAPSGRAPCGRAESTSSAKTGGRVCKPYPVVTWSAHPRAPASPEGCGPALEPGDADAESQGAGEGSTVPRIIDPVLADPSARA